MKIVKVLGSGCSKCEKVAQSISAIAAEKQIEIELIKETSPEAMMNYGVMRTPAVVVDEQLVHSGSIPHREDIESWLQ
ncbi:thioredoxin family protein [Thalassolituus sp. ST750PaO-4]|uniref:thioredoxin family protein n=1 Tax=Thalassolituus sp. ST750PaO-4 TaxID=2742965 RepID=UPI001CE3A632|nr:thioredoxin family protein [Thalassolituus sp. ST750PaO-4]MCA6061652.1 thioredoxin family protein [Thalassolituus sp. ST750PaO-4]